MSAFESVAGVPVEEGATGEGDWSYQWVSDGAEFEAVFVRGRGRWVLWTHPLAGGGATSGDLDPDRWSAVTRQVDARALVGQNAGCCP